MDGQTEVGVNFPTSGVDVTCEYGRQPGDTAPVAVNVRSFDTLADRRRGGSRPGLVKFLSETVNGGFLVQHLNILVDPTTPSLLADFDQIPSPPGAPIPTQLDPSTSNLTPRNPGRYVRVGGSGKRQVKKPVAQNQGYDATIVDIQVFDGHCTGTISFDPGMGAPDATFYFAAPEPAQGPLDEGQIYLEMGDAFVQFQGFSAPIRLRLNLTPSTFMRTYVTTYTILP